MLCSNEALKYVNYPTQALAKSCKMLPVMAAQVLVFGKRYSLLEYLYVVLVTAGIIVFRWKGGSSTEENSSFGLLLLFGVCFHSGSGPLRLRGMLREFTIVPLPFLPAFSPSPSHPLASVKVHCAWMG